MNKNEALLRIEELSKTLHYHNNLYYQKDTSEISDYEFDIFLAELIALEKEHPEYITVDSPSQRVGGTITKEFASVTHKYPMLSLSNTYSESEIREFANRLEAASLLSKDVQYNAIIESTGLSSTTIARITKWLKGPLGGYRLVLNRINTLKNLGTIQHHTPSKLRKGLILSS